MTHVGLVGFDVETFATRFTDDLTDIQEVVELRLNTVDIRTAVSGAV